jgi:CrcB protein
MPANRVGSPPLVAEPVWRAAAIGVGGALGTVARYGVDRAVASPALGFPWDTFTVNVTGSLILGLLVTAVTERWPPTRYVRPFAAIGFCGGFTTFSTFVVEVDRLGQHGQVGTAVTYLLVSLVAGLAAAALGIGLARGRLPWPATTTPIPDPDDVGLLGEQEQGRGRAGERP